MWYSEQPYNVDIIFTDKKLRLRYLFFVCTHSMIKKFSQDLKLRICDSFILPETLGIGKKVHHPPTPHPRTFGWQRDKSQQWWSCLIGKTSYIAWTGLRMPSLWDQTLALLLPLGCHRKFTMPWRKGRCSGKRSLWVFLSRLKVASQMSLYPASPPTPLKLRSWQWLCGSQSAPGLLACMEPVTDWSQSLGATK